MPTYDLVHTTAFPRFMEVLDRFRVPAKPVKRPLLQIETRCWGGSILFRTMDDPAALVSYEVAHSVVDELDTLPRDKARDVWHRVIARNRQHCDMPNTVAVATTPEGFGFVYERWKKNPAPGYRLFRARTEDNAAHLPPGYIDNLRASLPANLLLAYLDGEFVNLTSGSVYQEFDRGLNGSSAEIKREPPEPLHVGMDFNVEHGAGAVFVLRDGLPHAVGEVTETFDTPAMIQALKRRYAGHPIIVYPDASGRAREANNASVSDLSLLRSAGFQVFVNPRNPAVKDRVLAMNVMIHADGQRKLKVNVDACPTLVEALEKQSYARNGEPDKSAGLDHIVDAAGYFIAYRYPVASQRVRIERLRI